jgi:repressor of nif and glnA expression
MIERGKRFDWDALIPHAINLTKVLIIEAMQWIERPLSASDLERVFDRRVGLSAVSYHLKSLGKRQAVRRVRKRQVRGAVESHYFFTDAIRR